jgi:hypothetical protein
VVEGGQDRASVGRSSRHACPHGAPVASVITSRPLTRMVGSPLTRSFIRWSVTGRPDDDGWLEDAEGAGRRLELRHLPLNVRHGTESRPIVRHSIVGPLRLFHQAVDSGPRRLQ